MKKIRLFGDLEQFKSDWELDVKTPAEALRAIEANRPGFLVAADRGDYVLVLVDPHNEANCRAITMVNALDAWGDEILFVIPRAGGEFPAAALVPFFMGLGLSAGAAAIASAIVIAIVNIAISIALSMIASLISGTNDGTEARETERYDAKPSYLFNGVVNTTRQGHRIPILYGGPMLVGSMILSSQIHVKDIPV